MDMVTRIFARRLRCQVEYQQREQGVGADADGGSGGEGRRRQWEWSNHLRFHGCVPSDSEGILQTPRHDMEYSEPERIPWSLKNPKLVR